VCKKKEEDDHGPLEHQGTSRLSDGPFCSLPGALHAKHASALGISNRSVRRILHQDRHFHTYKMVVVQELTQQDWINRTEACQHLIERLPDDAVVFFF